MSLNNARRTILFSYVNIHVDFFLNFEEISRE